MSTTLKWFPTDIEGHNLPDAIKFAMRNSHGDPVQVLLGPESLSYLQGLSDAGVPCVQGLIEAINLHGQVRVEEV